MEITVHWFWILKIIYGGIFLYTLWKSWKSSQQPKGKNWNNWTTVSLILLILSTISPIKMEIAPIDTHQTKMSSIILKTNAAIPPRVSDNSFKTTTKALNGISTKELE